MSQMSDNMKTLMKEQVKSLMQEDDQQQIMDRIRTTNEQLITKNIQLESQITHMQSQIQKGKEEYSKCAHTIQDYKEKNDYVHQENINHLKQIEHFKFRTK